MESGGMRRRLSPEVITMRVLVSAASRHGATTEIADAIAAGLTRRGVEAQSVAPEQVRSFDGFDAVVLGSAVYMGQWLEPARRLVREHKATLAGMPVWLFSSGPVGPPEQRVPKRNEVDVTAQVEAISPVGHRLFAGRLDRGSLSRGERMITRVIGGVAGDFRDWEEIDGFAGEVAAHLATRAAAPVGSGT
jgi:menaquinone-dependent protoporphyrinogen oxidase